MIGYMLEYGKTILQLKNHPIIVLEDTDFIV